MVQIPPWLHSTFKELSNEYSHAQIRVKMKKLWSRQVREEKPVAVQKMCRDRKWCRDQEMASRQEIVSRPENLCHDQEIVSRPENLVANKNAAET